MVQAVLFDLDGTLLNTLPDICKSVNEALKKFSYPPVTPEQTKAYVGDGARKLIERAVPAGAADTEACYEYFRTLFASSDNALTFPYEGEIALLKRLKAANVKLGIVTNKPQDAALRAVKCRLPEVEFDFIGGDTGDFPCKPDPSLARYAALTMRVFPEDCAFVGDGETDVKTARAAGMFSVACLWGYRTREQLEKAGATRFARDFSQLGELLFST